MRRRVIAVVIGLAVLAAAGFAAVYLLFFNEDSPPEFELTPVDEQAEPAGGDGIDGIWTVSPGSEAGYRVREKLANLPAQSDAVGRTNDVTGTVEIDGTAVTSAAFEVDVTTLKSDQERRDNRIRRDGLESDRFPTATFELTEAIDLGDAGAARASVDAIGELTIHGVTAAVTIPIDAARNGDRIELVGSITFPFSDFGMDPPNVAGFVTVEDDATLDFKILLERSPR